jgi:hypothetical protein
MTRWEYLLLALPRMEAPTVRRGDSEAVRALDDVGEQGWEAVGITELAGETVAVLLKRPKTDESSALISGR